MLNLLCILMIFNLKKIKELVPRKKIRNKVIVLSKSAGIDDLICSQKKYNKNTLYLNCSRTFFVQIYMAIFNINNEKDAKIYALNEPENLKKKYVNFLVIFLNKLKKNYKFDAFIGFNFYISEIGLHTACRQSKIPFIMLYKEGVGTELENKYFAHILEKKKNKFHGSKIAVYSNIIKKILIKSKVVNKDKIDVVGCSRLSKSFIYKNITPQNQILYYAIQNDRGLPSRFLKKYGSKNFEDLKIAKNYNPKFNWENLHLKTLKILKKFASENPKINIIIKIKTGMQQNKFYYKNMPTNIKLHSFGTGHQLLEESKIVIGWNTTAVIEGIAANRFILLPYFQLNNNNLKKNSELVLKLKNENYGFSENDFYKKLSYFIKKKYNKKKINNNHFSLKYYLGNADNRANLRLHKFLQKNIRV